MSIRERKANEREEKAQEKTEKLLNQPGSAVYQIENLSKLYPKTSRPANDNISLRIEPGEVFGLLGSNGAGKSTLIRQMVNLTAPSSGRVLLFGQDIARKPELIAKCVAYMPQKPQALLDLTPEEAIYFTGHMRGMKRLDAKREAARLVDEWGLGEVRKKPVRQLSGGQHRLVGLAITLVADLPVLILDEPTNELDPAYRRQVWERLINFNKQGDKTIILVTHNVQEAERVIGRVAIMSKGRVVGLGRVGELKEQIDRSVRLELFVKPESAAEVEEVLAGVERATEVRPQHWSIMINREGAEEVIHYILSRVRLERLEDFRVHTATLEDVYMALTGEVIAEQTEA